MDDVAIGHLMHYISITIWISLILFVFAAPFYMVDQLISFQQTSADVISRYGGVTQKAKDTVNAMGENYYNGHFGITEAASTKTYNAGDTIPYTIHVEIPIISNMLDTNLNCTTESDIRNTSE